MRIAFITFEFPPDTGKGGVGTYTKLLAEMLAKKNFDVHVFCGSLNRNFTEINCAVTIHRIKCTGPDDFTTKVMHPFFVVHGQTKFSVIESPEIHSNARLIKNKMPNLPLVIRMHAPNLLVETFKKKYIPFWSKFRYMLGAFRRLKWDLGYWRKYDHKSDPDYISIFQANVITAPSMVMKQWAVKNWQLDPVRIKLIPNFFKPAPEFLQIPIIENTSCKTVLFYGRLNVLKGLINATKAMKIILKKNASWNFRLVGDDGYGPDGKGSMKAWIEKELYQYKSRVLFEPGIPYEEIPLVLQNAEIVLQPSLFESFSYTCLEAMSAGKAVIGSRNTGMSEIITHGKDGLLFESGSVVQLQKCIQQLIDDDILRKSIAQNARGTAIHKFSTEKLCDQYISTYQDAVKMYE